MIKYTEKKKRNQEFAPFIAPHVSGNTLRRVCECGSWIEMYADESKEKKKVRQANFCKNRFCPVCAWRQAQKDALKIGILMDYLAREREYAFIMVTLTAPNVAGEDLRDEITRYNRAFKNLVDREDIVRMNRGYIRKLEITYNTERKDYHPHFHCIFAVSKKYFKDRSYLSQAKWLAMWRNVMKDEAITQVDVRRVKLAAADGRDGRCVEDIIRTSKQKAVNEVAKYAAKDSDYTRNHKVFDVFYKALKGRQVLTFNGAFKEVNAMFKAGELDEYIVRDETKYKYMILYRWGNGEYIEKGCRELDEKERSQVNGQLVDMDEGVDVDG